MACFTPLEGWLSRERTPRGKRVVVFSRDSAYSDLPVVIPCGRCRGCRLEKVRQWAMRCVHEASLHEENCFVTLTYNDKHLPDGGSLRKKDFQDFMKRLRSRFDDRVIRFYHCGEYGEKSERPHYHALLFGFDFADKVYWTTREGYPVWRSDTLESLWPFGLSEIGAVTFESAAYCVRYVMKKLISASEEEIRARYGDREPEYATMSRRPGIGKDWFLKFGEEVYGSDSVVLRGIEMRPPRYYDALFENVDAARLKEVKCTRRKRVKDAEQRGSRMYARQEVLKAKLNLKKGGAL